MLIKDLEEFKRFSIELGLYASSLKFNKFDSKSVEDVVKMLSEKIDDFIRLYPNNKIIEEVATDLKKIYIKAFYEKAEIAY